MARVRIELELKTLRGRKIIGETHAPPLDLDGGSALWMVEKWADEAFLKKHAPKGIVRVDVGGGALDHHPTATTSGKEGKCAATLTAKELDIQDDPGLQRILELVLSQDLKGGGGPLHLAALVKVIDQQRSPQEAFQWMKIALEAEYEAQVIFWTATREEYERIALAKDIRAGNRVVKLVVLLSDNPQISRYARSSEGGEADVIVQQERSGHVQIWGGRGLPLTDVVRMIRVAELHNKGLLSVPDRITLAKEGLLQEVEEWYFHRGGEGALFNGKPTDGNKDTPATGLPLDQIVRIVKMGIDPSLLSDNCPRSHCIFQGCGWHAWGLNRCENIRRRRF